MKVNEESSDADRRAYRPCADPLIESTGELDVEQYSTTTFLQNLVAWGLLTDQQTAVLKDLPSAQEPCIQGLVEDMTRRYWLTPLQAELVLAGRGHELVVDSYVLAERLGHGGMGQVFKAYHRILKQACALKVLRTECLANQSTVRRFRREMELVAKLNHPNIVQALDAGEDECRLFFVMELIDGLDLDRLLHHQGPLPVCDAADYVRQAALGLQHAFEQGLVHRDVKPSNLLLTRTGVIKVSDLGMAKLRERPREEIESLTPSGLVIGTPDYIAPEQIQNSKAVDVRADTYSLGCSFYQLLTGRLPFSSPHLEETLIKHLTQEAIPITAFRSDVPAAIIDVVQRMMSKKPDLRHQEPREVAHELSLFLQGRSGNLATVFPINLHVRADYPDAAEPCDSSEWDYPLQPLSQADVETPGEENKGETLELHVSPQAVADAFAKQGVITTETGSTASCKGIRIDDFQVGNAIHAGSKATIYFARDLNQNRDVALKVLRRRLAVEDPLAVRRFHREASLMALLDHEHVVRFYGKGKPGARHFFAMELVDGRNLKNWQRELRRNGLPYRLNVSDAVHLTLCCGSALQYVHQRGVVHRNVKPKNVLISRDGRIKLADFGLAKAKDHEELPSAQKSWRIGTPAYVAPEQFHKFDRSDSRSDLYSLGCTFYYLLTGVAPFGRASGQLTPKEILRNKTNFELLLPSHVDERVPASLDPIVARLLAPHPDDRYQCAAELVEALTSLELSSGRFEHLEMVDLEPV